MDAIDSDDNSIVGFSLGGTMSGLDSRDINKNGEIKSNSLGSSFQLLGIDFNRLMEVSLDKLKRPITDGLDTKKMKATFVDGLLTVFIPVKEEESKNLEIEIL